MASLSAAAFFFFSHSGRESTWFRPFCLLCDYFSSSFFGICHVLAFLSFVVFLLLLSHPYDDDVR